MLGTPSGRRRSSPPMIILLDVLFVFMFSALLQNNSSIQVKFSGDPPSKDVAWIHRKEGRVYVSGMGGDIVLEEFALRNSIEYWKTFSCALECPENNGGLTEFAIYGDLYSQVAHMNFLACSMRNAACNKMVIYVGPDGGVDFDETLRSNDALKEISGFDGL